MGQRGGAGGMGYGRVWRGGVDGCVCVCGGERERERERVRERGRERERGMEGGQRAMCHLLLALHWYICCRCQKDMAEV